MLTNDWLYWVPVLIFAVIIPYVWYLDIKYREIHHQTWILPVVILTSVTVWLYLFEIYPADALLIPIPFILMYFIAMKLHLFEGADFMFLSILSLFFVVNPLSGHLFMPLVLFEMLLCILVVCNFVLFVFGKKAEQFPMIPIISGAFFMAVIFG